jgi:hypothetical protein
VESQASKERKRRKKAGNKAISASLTDKQPVSAPVSSPVKSSPTPVKTESTQSPTPVATPVNNSSNTTPVRPEVVYEEKEVVVINPSKESLPLSTPVKRTDRFAEVDNSVDGFLAIKHDK